LPKDDAAVEESVNPLKSTVTPLARITIAEPVLTVRLVVT